ncbi:recombinase family protein [Hymenobacter crusticola]|uniref:Resolvase/invertase-type recombinase catalytic domain-containing protein n=1 Tax=Hymenobacter crusticola TaxID=1770526 RepID=A0A243W534_9BACT|nr:recombinase family protein [Hymenobacter crusticola]OUJ67986.1 hypothetical protein BXP70_28325 [Hymenobacter crusticola]
MEDLTQAGCTRIFQEKASGTRTHSPVLDELLAAVREDDIVVVNRLARLGRNTVHTIQFVEEFHRRGIHFRALVLSQRWGSSSKRADLHAKHSFIQHQARKDATVSLAMLLSASPGVLP